ncbi:MAG: hypothetical protein JST67_03850 [Bacteroidetes bacterium]|nr:hypothetical protein [Bacteroidota bacterium]
MRLKPIFFLCLLLPLWAKAQLINDAELKQQYRFRCGKWKYYAAVDAVRLLGVGAEYRPSLKFGLDLQAGLIHHNFYLMNDKRGIFSGMPSDYFYMQGGYIALTPKFYLGEKKQFYLGLNIAFYDYGYKQKWINSDAQNGMFFITGSYPPGNSLMNRHTLSWGNGLAVGGAFYIHPLFSVEPFVVLGFEQTNDDISSYQYPGAPNPTNFYARSFLFNAVIGIKFCFGSSRAYYARKYYMKKAVAVAGTALANENRNNFYGNDELAPYYPYAVRAYMAELKELYNQSKGDTVFMETQVKNAAEKIKGYMQYLHDTQRRRP